MNWKNLLLSAALMTASALMAQPYRATPIAYDWVEISGLGINSGIVGDDQIVGQFQIGFDFPFYGQAFEWFWICSDGYFSFGPWGGVGPTPIPNPNNPNNAIYPLWLDLYPPAGGIVWYYYDPVNVRYIIEWDNVMSYAMPRTPQKFEVIIHRDGVIYLMYHTVQPPCLNASTVGIENATGTEAIQCTYMGSGPLEPASQTGIRISAETSPVTITLWLSTFPPPPPQEFHYYISLHNQTDSTVTCETWVMIQFPNGVWHGPALGPIRLHLPPGDSVNRLRTQYIYATWPAGNYWYEGRVGDYPDVVWDTSGFAFEKLTGGDWEPGTGEWIGGKRAFGSSSIIEYGNSEFPGESSIFASPNPFNPTTAIRYQLPTDGHVSLKVFDVSGRLVAILVDGWREAGMHEVTFDGSGLPSGIYLARIVTDNESHTCKLVLMK